jgi:hypothetical protein
VRTGPVLIVGLVMACATSLPAWAYGLRTGAGLIICDTRNAAEQLRLAHEAASLAIDWPKRLTIAGCHVSKPGLRIQPHGADAHDPGDQEILAVEIPALRSIGYTTDWIYQTRTVPGGED